MYADLPLEPSPGRLRLVLTVAHTFGPCRGAAAATEASAKWPVPDHIPELGAPGWRAATAVRDMPIDYAVLIENICDPDHGLFAHQNTAFDMYTASEASPQTVEVRPAEPAGGGDDNGDDSGDDGGQDSGGQDSGDAPFVIESATAATYALTARGAEGGGASQRQRTRNAEADAAVADDSAPTPLATTQFFPPNVITIGRRGPH